jgi:ketosteroid isomerase-like protein
MGQRTASRRDPDMHRSPELEDLVARWFAAATAGDASVVDTLVSALPGVCLIGSDPVEWFRGGEAVAEFLRGEVTNAGGQARFSPAGTEAYVEGTVGWATTRLTITLPDGRHISPRWSSVFHREGDTWRFVQTHASIGVDNDAIGWTYSE